MAAPTNTLISSAAVGNREDLSDIIYRVVPEETPFIQNIGTAKANAVLHEWQTESLASAASNINVEGNAYTFTTANLTTRLGNTCQILVKTASISETEDAVKKAGRTSETARQKLLRGLEAKRDLELQAIGNNASVASGSRALGGALAWCTSNTSVGAGGSNGATQAGGTTAATNGTQRAFTETLLKTVMASTFNSGGKPSQMYMGATQKQEFSSFTGIAVNRHEVTGNKMAVVTGAADVYVSDFGSLNAIPHAYGLTRDVLGIDPKYWGMAVLRPWASQELAMISDATQFAIVTEQTLEARNEKSSFAIRDLS